LEREAIHPPLLVGRAQGSNVYELIATKPALWLDLIQGSIQSSYTSEVFASPLPLPGVVDVQLRYDVTRRDIISAFYSGTNTWQQLLHALWPIAKASASEPHEPFYVDASPDMNGMCPWCNVQLSR
jgi:hypothetical protein